MSALNLREYEIIADEQYVWIYTPRAHVEIPIEAWLEMVLWWVTEECQSSLGHK